MFQRSQANGSVKGALANRNTFRPGKQTAGCAAHGDVNFSLCQCIEQAAGLVECEMPWEGLRAASAGAGRMRLEPARAEEDMHAFAAERFDAPAERDPAGKRGVHERQHDDRRVHSGHLGEDAEGVGIAGALRPFVDRVVGRRGDDDGIRDSRSRRAWLAVLAADGIAGKLLDGGLIEELQSSGSRNDLNRPAPVQGKLDKGADCRGGSCAADDDRQDTAGCAASQGVTPICVAN